VTTDEVLAALIALAHEKGLVSDDGGVEIHFDRFGVDASLTGDEGGLIDFDTAFGATVEQAVTRLWQRVDAHP
jgi:hypothetical protein